MLFEYGSVFIMLAIVLGLYMTWGIGANDVANAMGTSVGSGAISIKNRLDDFRASLIAASFASAPELQKKTRIYSRLYVHGLFRKLHHLKLHGWT